eukprot:4776157-Amphidinium_carterae.5
MDAGVTAASTFVEEEEEEEEEEEQLELGPKVFQLQAHPSRPLKRPLLERGRRRSYGRRNERKGIRGCIANGEGPRDVLEQEEGRRLLPSPKPRSSSNPQRPPS